MALLDNVISLFITEGINMYVVKKPKTPINSIVEVPGSKSITNRALLLASLADGKSVLTNALFSDDTRHFMGCLRTLGYNLDIDENAKKVTLTGGKPISNAEINVGSAGTGARFITAMLSHFKGEYKINASEQMKARPMKPLFDLLIKLGAKIEYLEKEGFLPIRLYGSDLSGGSIELDFGKSSQYLSALLLSGSLFKKPLYIKPVGKETSKSYVDMTIKMIRGFGGDIDIKNDVYGITGTRLSATNYTIEPDVSSACYFYAAAALTGGSVLIKNVHLSSIQGDIRFLFILQKIGCRVIETETGVRVYGPEDRVLKSIEVDMNNCSDQTMTLAALAIFANSPTHITNIDHIQYQESNRINAIITEFDKMGIKCDRTKQGLLIYPGKPKPACLETYNDHRLAMAFSLIGLRAEGIKIINPDCISKTFENYFDIFSEITGN